MIPLKYNIRSIFVRKTTTFATAGGIALVVFTFSAAQMLTEGVKRTMSRSGSEDIAIVMSRGADAELSSNVDSAHVGLVKAQREVSQQRGQPDAVAEIVGVLAIDKIGTEGGVSNVQIRGIEENVWSFRRTARVIDGRRPRPGSDEVVIGRAIRGRFAGVDLNQSFEIKKNRRVRVVGVFEDSGSSFESEVWGDIETVRSAFARQALVSSVRVRLRSPSALDSFTANVERNRQLGLSVMSEPAYYEAQSRGTAGLIGGIGGAVAFFFALGAMIGAMITMYSAVSNRNREIGTLRALGFSRFQILISFLIESTLLAVGGGIIGAVASIGMGAFQFSMMNLSSWSEMVFRFEPTLAIVGTSLAFGAIMGLLGGFFPAVRAARVSVLDALRG